MTTEFKLMRNALDATHRAMEKPMKRPPRLSNETIKARRGFTLVEQLGGELTEAELRDEKLCPKCHGPMNLVRATCPKDREFWLCDNPKCPEPGMEIVEP